MAPRREPLTMEDREDISRGLAKGLDNKDIAFSVGRDESVVSRDIARHAPARLSAGRRSRCKWSRAIRTSRFLPDSAHSTICPLSAPAVASIHCLAVLDHRRSKQSGLTGDTDLTSESGVAGDDLPVVKGSRGHASRQEKAWPPGASPSRWKTGKTVPAAWRKGWKIRT